MFFDEPVWSRIHGPHILSACSGAANGQGTTFAARSGRPAPEMPQLPMNQASASEQFLANHLTPVACRRGDANAQLITELMCVTCLGRFPQRVIYGACPGQRSGSQITLRKRRRHMPRK